MSTYSRGRHRSDPDSATEHICSWTMCNVRVTYRFKDAGVYMCQEHALLTWAAVQDMNASGQLKAELSPMPKRSKDYGSVYYIRIGELVKIGYTNNILERLATYPPNMEVLLIRHGSRDLERREHIRFGEHRTDGREWFIANERVLQMISEVTDGIDREWEPEWFRRRSHQPQAVFYRNLGNAKAGHGSK